MSMVEQGRVYNNATKSFFDSLSEMSNHFNEDAHIKVCDNLVIYTVMNSQFFLELLSHIRSICLKDCIGDIVKLGRNLIEFGFILVDHSERSFAKTLTNFIKE